MKQKFQLHIASTGELIEEGETELSLAVWWGRRERKILRLKNRAERFKEAIRTADVAAGWVDDGRMQEYDSATRLAESKRVFRGIDKAIEKRLNFLNVKE